MTCTRSSRSTPEIVSNKAAIFVAAVFTEVSKVLNACNVFVQLDYSSVLCELLFISCSKYVLYHGMSEFN